MPIGNDPALALLDRLVTLLHRVDQDRRLMQLPPLPVLLPGPVYHALRTVVNRDQQHVSHFYLWIGNTQINCYPDSGTARQLAATNQLSAGRRA